MASEEERFKCPRCGGTDYAEVDCGPDGYDDDITYESEVCENCGLWYDGWVGRWFVDVQSWRDVGFAEEYVPSKQPRSVSDGSS